MKIHTHVIPVLALLLASCSLWQSPRSGNGQSSALADGQRRTAPRRSLQQADGVAGVPLLAAPLRGEKLIKREGYTVSYNTKYRIANYVAWKLTPERMRGSAKRAPFFEDPELASNEKVYFGDYSGSGFDRGHMCPAGDNKWSTTAMLDCFIMSNICPQNHTLNGGDWRILEEVRWQARRVRALDARSSAVGHRDDLQERAQGAAARRTSEACDCDGGCGFRKHRHFLYRCAEWGV